MKGLTSVGRRARAPARAALTALLSMLFAASLFGCAAPKDLGADVYEADAMGHNGPLTVRVTMDGTVIASVEVTSHDETEEVAQKALTDWCEDVISMQSVDTDAITGATDTCNAIAQGVRLALSQAGLDPTDYAGVFVGEDEPCPSTTSEIVIVGAGGAGLCAAVAAHQNGAESIVVLEKTMTVGGNTAISTGMYNAVDPIRQTAQGIEDSTDKHFSDTYEGGDCLGKPELVRKLADEAYDGLLWYESLGMTFEDELAVGVGGMQLRGHYPENNAGGEYIRVLKNYCDKNGIRMIREARATSILLENGRACGVYSTSGGEETLYRATKAVILATGGFGANAQLREQWDKTLPEGVLCACSPASTGDGIEMAQNVGASVIHMQYIQLFPIADPTTGSLAVYMPGGTKYGIWLNSDGERFVAEDGRRDVTARAILEQKGGNAFVLVDALAAREEKNEQFLSGLVDIGRATKADSLDELAELLGMDGEKLKASVHDYNAAVLRGTDAKFGRKLLFSTISEPPFFATENKPAVLTTLGGVEIDAMARVLNTDGLPIPGLYAAGEVTGGVHGSNRLGANALTEVTVFGRIAGKNAARE